MYESPITLIENVARQIMRETEDGVFYEIQKQYGVDVDKEELTKALQYDRHQYDRGYADGKNSALDSVLDKIESEIVTEGDAIVGEGEYFTGFHIGMICALKIINKYKAESEENK